MAKTQKNKATSGHLGMLKVHTCPLKSAPTPHAALLSLSGCIAHIHL